MLVKLRYLDQGLYLPQLHLIFLSLIPNFAFNHRLSSFPLWKIDPLFSQSIVPSSFSNTKGEQLFNRSLCSLVPQMVSFTCTEENEVAERKAVPIYFAILSET